MTLLQAIRQGQDLLQNSQASFGDAGDHMTQIVEYALVMSRAQIYQDLNAEISDDAVQIIRKALQRRLAGEPLQYISGRAGFWKHDFTVGPGVLIPRPETELLIEVLLKKSGLSKVRVAELGAGSGNIGLSVLGERPAWEWWAFEKNTESLPYAKKNHDTLLMGSPNYHLVNGDFFSLAAEHQPFDWIVTNPPYVPSAEITTLSKEVQREPLAALDGGADGLDLIRLLAKSSGLLAQTGGILMEMAENQGNAVCELLAEQGFREIELYQDRAGLDRAVSAKR